MPQSLPTENFQAGAIEPLSGFAIAPRHDVPDAPLQHLPPRLGVADRDVQVPPSIASASISSIRRLVADRYLQCELHCSVSEGWLEVRHNGALIDRAELIAGWQHAAVDLANAPTPCDLSLHFLDSAKQPIEDVAIRHLFLSENWGQGQRKRLKCYVPFSSAGIFADFSVYPCCARQWLKPGLEAGNTKADEFSDLWNGPVYKKMRTDFLTGDYGAACRDDVCPILRGESAPIPPTDAVVHAVNEGLTELPFGPANLHHDIDMGCNLACTMCRNEKILPNQANIDRALEDIDSAIGMDALEKISFSGAGEIFVMRKVIKLLESDYFSKRNISVSVTSNITNFGPALWKRIEHNHFAFFAISVDGCSTELYESVRLGARWSVVEANMRFLAELQAQGKVESVIWQYTVQRANVADVGRAIERARELGYGGIRLIAQLGTLRGTNGNMFEDYDLAALDQLYDQIDGVGGFNDPRVIVSELGIDNRRYRTVERRLEVAEYIYDRAGFSPGSRRLQSPSEWKKCSAIVTQLLADLADGTVERPAHLPARHQNFVRRFRATARNAIPNLRALAGLIAKRERLGDAIDDRRLAFQAKAFLKAH